MPQRVYDHGQKQWDFEQSEPVSFNVNGLSGINMGDALCEQLAGLDGHDDPVLQNAPKVIYCRLLVRFFFPHSFSLASKLTLVSSSPDTRLACPR